MKITFMGTYYGSWEDFVEEFGNVTVLDIDDTVVLAMCEICGLPVLENQDMVDISTNEIPIGQDPVFVHTKCDTDDGYLC